LGVISRMAFQSLLATSHNTEIQRDWEYSAIGST